MENENITYQFTASPSKLLYICDPFTFKLITYLINRESYWRAHNKLKNGYFFVAIEELSKQLSLQSSKDVKSTIEALYREKLIDVICEGIGRGKGNKLANQFKINWIRIKEIDNIPFDELDTFRYSIKKLSRKEKLTYTEKTTKQSLEQVKGQICKQIVPNVVPTTLEEITGLKEDDNIINNIVEENINTNSNVISENNLLVNTPIPLKIEEDKLKTYHDMYDQLFEYSNFHNLYEFKLRKDKLLRWISTNFEDSKLQELFQPIITDYQTTINNYFNHKIITQEEYNKLIA